MKRFPETVRKGMAASGAAATCVPVKLDSGDWETAVYFQLAGPECKKDRRELKHAQDPVPLGVEMDLFEHQHGSAVLLRLEVHTFADDPLAGEILLTPGDNTTHFDALKLLARQPRLCWFFGDQQFWIIHSQQHALSDEQHRGFEALMSDAITHDAMVRLTGRYDANSVVSEIVSNYELRAGAGRFPAGDMDGGQAGKSRN